MAGDQNNGAVFFMGLFQRLRPFAAQRDVAHAVDEFLARVNLDQCAAGVVGHFITQAVYFGFVQFGADILQIVTNTFCIARQGGHNPRHDPADQWHADTVGKQHHQPEHPADQQVDDVIAAGFAFFCHLGLWECGFCAP